MKKVIKKGRVIFGEILEAPKIGERLKIWRDVSKIKKEGDLTITETSPVKSFKEIAENVYEVITEDNTLCFVNL